MARGARPTGQPDAEYSPDENIVGDLTGQVIEWATNNPDFVAKTSGFFPVYHIPISKSQGIEVSGKFTTNDDSLVGGVSYVTVGRQSVGATVPDGLGFAWKKSQMIPLTYDADGNLFSSQFDFNCYLVDNTYLNTDVFQSSGAIHSPSRGDSGIGGTEFLTYGRREILQDTTYQFKLKITTNYEITLWILDDGLDLDLTVDSSYAANAETGVPLRQYGYVAKRGSTDPLYSPNATGTHFGISVLDTKHAEWRYSDLLIKSITADFPVSMFKIDADPAYILDGDDFRVFWKGWGQWDDGEVGERGASLFIRNITTDLWELIGSNTAVITSIDSAKTIEGSFTDIVDYRDTNNFVTLLAMATDANATAEINTEYASIDNVTPSGIHGGGMVDIYVNDPEHITTTSNEILVPSSGTFLLSSANGFLLPTHTIISITSTLTGNELVEGTDYTISVIEPKNAWSTATSLKLSVTNAPANLTVLYRYYSQGAAIQTFIESEDYRNPAVNPLIKIKPPAILTVKTMDYRGDVDEDNLKLKISDWVNALETTFELSDFINFVYDEGVDYINLNTLDIVRRTYDYEGTVLQDDQTTPDTYTLSGLQAFYTDRINLYGVLKLG